MPLQRERYAALTPSAMGRSVVSGLTMGCDKCDELIDTRKRSISLLRNAVRKVAGAQWPDSRMAVQEMTRLQQTCRDASNALREHMRQAHSLNEDSGSS